MCDNVVRNRREKRKTSFYFILTKLKKGKLPISANYVTRIYITYAIFFDRMPSLHIKSYYKFRTDFFLVRICCFFWSFSYSYIFFVELDRVPLFCRVCAREKMSRPVSFISSKPMTSSTFYSPSTFLACLYLTYIIFYFFYLVFHTHAYTHTHTGTRTPGDICLVLLSRHFFFVSNFYVSSGGNFFYYVFCTLWDGGKITLVCHCLR